MISKGANVVTELKGSRSTRPPYIPLNDEEMSRLIAGFRKHLPQVLEYGEKR